MATLTIDVDRFDSLRKEQGLDTLALVADALGVNKSTASRVLSGKSAPGPTFISAVLLRFPVKFEDVFAIADEETPAAHHEADAVHGGTIHSDLRSAA